MLNLFAQVWGFMRERRAWWLAPLIIMFLLLALLIIFAQTSPLSPLIYTLF